MSETASSYFLRSSAVSLSNITTTSMSLLSSASPLEQLPCIPIKSILFPKLFSSLSEKNFQPIFNINHIFISLAHKKGVRLCPLKNQRTGSDALNIFLLSLYFKPKLAEFLSHNFVVFKYFIFLIAFSGEVCGVSCILCFSYLFKYFIVC